MNVYGELFMKLLPCLRSKTFSLSVIFFLILPLTSVACPEGEDWLVIDGLEKKPLNTQFSISGSEVVCKTFFSLAPKDPPSTSKKILLEKSKKKSHEDETVILTCEIPGGTKVQSVARHTRIEYLDGKSTENYHPVSLHISPPRKKPKDGGIMFGPSSGHIKIYCGAPDEYFQFPKTKN